MLQSPDVLATATAHVLATAEAFAMDGHVTTEQDGNPNDQQILSRRVQSWDMRVDGYSYRDIAQRTGVSLTTAYHDVQVAAELIDDVRKAKAERVLDVELARYDKASLALLPKVLKGEPKAVMAFVRVGEQRARLLGMNAPEKVLHAGMVITGEQLAGSRSSLDEKLEGLRQRMIGTGPDVVNVTPGPRLITPADTST